MANLENDKPFVVGNTPPNDLEAEKAILGAMMIDEDCLHEVLEILESSNFYAPSHRIIFKAMAELSQSTKRVDHVLVYNELKKKGDAEKVGGAAYVGGLTLNVPSIANATHYAKIVKDKSHLRELLKLTMAVQEGIFQSENAEEIFDKAESNLMALSELRVKKSSHDISSLMETAMSDFKDRLEGNYKSRGLSCQFHQLMKYLTGFNPGDMIVVAARPAMGKTSFALKLLLNFSLRQKAPVALFTLEMSAAQIANNLLCIETQTDGTYWSRPDATISQEASERITRGIDRLSSAGIIIDGEQGLTPQILRSKGRRYLREFGIRAIIVDYLSLMHAPAEKSRDGRVQEISYISRMIESIARELEIPIIALAQLNRAVEARAGNKPKMSDLRESGSIEQDADAIILLHRPDYYNPEEREGECDIILAKNRHGQTGTVALMFYKNMMRFDNMSTQ